MNYKLMIDYENNAEEWWDAAQALTNSQNLSDDKKTFTCVVRDLISEDEIVVSNEDGAAFLRVAKELAGWYNPESIYAPYPVIVSETNYPVR